VRTPRRAWSSSCGNSVKTSRKSFDVNGSYFLHPTISECSDRFLQAGVSEVDMFEFPVMRELHWLPVRQRIRFKTALLVFKFLHGLAPACLSEYCKLTTGHSHLRSANMCLLSVPRTRTTYGDRSFAISGPVAWNSLPVAVRSSDVMEETFRRQLKTFLLNFLDSYVDSYRDIDSYVISADIVHLWPLRTCTI